MALDDKSAPSSGADLKRFRDNLRDELNGAALYAALAAAEADPLRKDLFLQLAQAESKHAQQLAGRSAGRQRWPGIQLLPGHGCLRRRQRAYLGASDRFCRSGGGRVMKDKKGALDTLVREELGIDPQELGGNAWTAAATSFALFSAGAIFPVLPFIWMQGRWAIGASALASGVALAGVGMLTSLFNGRGPWYSAGRQLLFGSVAAAVTYGLGALLGTALA